MSLEINREGRVLRLTLNRAEKRNALNVDLCTQIAGAFENAQSDNAVGAILIDAKGPHGLTLHFHAQAGGKESEKVLEYLQSIKKLELKPLPFLKKPSDPAAKGP